MKHQIAGFKLNRSSSHRQALYKNLLTALITHGAITTTLTKAKAIQGQADSLISTAKKGQLSHRRQLDRVLNQRFLVNRLVDEIAPHTGTRNSGFTRIVKLQNRRGDAALMARLELVDKIPVKEAVVAPPTKKTTPSKTVKPAKAAKKPAAPLPKDHDITAPEIKPQIAMKPSLLRRKSGER